MKDPREFFPGDPPVFDLLACMCGIVALLSLSVLVVSHVRGWRWMTRTSVLAFTMALVPITWFWFERHVGPWVGFRNILVDFENEARHALAYCNQDFDCAVDYLDRTHGTTTYRFTPEHRPVRLYIRRSSDARVGVDYGRGANAVFDTRWMLTTYSD